MQTGGSAWSSRNQWQSELWDRIHFLCGLGRRVIFTTESGSISEKGRAERSDGNLYAGAERDAGRRRIILRMVPLTGRTLEELEDEN